MDKKEFVKKFLAGLFAIVGIGFFVTVVFIIGLERGLTEPKFQTNVLFNQVSGLNEGAPVRLSGINVGTVAKISFLDAEISGRNIQVAINIFKKYEKQFAKCSRITITTEGVLGEKLIEISEDARKKNFDLTQPIIGEDPLNVEDIADVMTKTAVSLNKATENFNSMLKEFHYISKRSRRLLNRVEQKIIVGNLFKVF